MLVGEIDRDITEETWCLASVSPNPFRVWNFYSDIEAAQENMDRANHREDQCCYEPMRYGDYLRKEKDSLVNTPLKEITEEQYDDALNVLPPMQWRRGTLETFLMSEFWTRTYTTMYAKYFGKCYQKMVDVCDPNTWITVTKINAHEEERKKYASLSH